MASWLCVQCRRTVELRTDALGRLWERCHCGVRRLQPIAPTPRLRVVVTVAAVTRKMIPPKVRARRPFDTSGWTWAREARICQNPTCRKPFLGRTGVNARCCSTSCRWRLYYLTRIANRHNANRHKHP